MNGKIDQIGNMSGDLNPKQQLTGNLNPKHQIKGTIQFPHVIPPDIYTGETVITPSSFLDKELNTEGKMVKTNIIVKPTPYFATSNESGITIYIGNEDLVVFGGN